MRVEFFYFMICLLIPRLLRQWEDRPRQTLRRRLGILLLEALLLLPLLSLRGLLPLLLFLLFYHGICRLLEKKIPNPFSGRILEFLLLIAGGSFLFGSLPDALGFNGVSRGLAEFLISRNALLGQTEPRTMKGIILYGFGALALVNEMNHLIRYILHQIKTEPHLASPEQAELVDSKELSRGKIIGAIERLLFFLFVLTGQYSSIAFILTAKGLTRFKELDDKNFAEYFLIGTLLSSAISIFWAYLIGRIAQSL